MHNGRMDNEEFLAEMKRRREAAEAEKKTHTQYTIPGNTSVGAGGGSEKGLVGMLMRLGVAKTPSQANNILIGVIGASVLFIAWVMFF